MQSFTSEKLNATAKSSKLGKIKEGAAKYVFLVSALFSIVAVVAIIGFIFYNSIPAFAEIGVFQFLFSGIWSPANGYYGIFNMIVASVEVTLGALIVGGVGGVFSAICLSRFCPKKVRAVVFQAIKLLAGVPSVIYGFFGIQAIIPILRSISPTGQGEGLLACSIILGIMIAPTVISLTKTNLDAVSQSYYEGALALGCNHEQAVFKVTFPAAKSGVIAAIVLGMGRAIGETMAVVMVAGNNPQLAFGLFDYICTMTGKIVMEMGDATGVHRSALIALGLVLLVFVLLINLLFNLLKGGIGKENKRKQTKTLQGEKDFIPTFKKGGLVCKILKYLSYVCLFALVAMLVWLILFVLINGLPHINANLLFGKSGNRGATLAPALVSTLVLIIASLLIALPIGVFAAIYLVEYAKPGSKIVKAIRVFVETLSGVPSIVFGIFGMIVFTEVLGMGYSLIAGALTLVLMILPTIIRSTEESLLSVSDSLREGSYGLGVGKLRTILCIVLPQALPGIFAAIVLSMGRIVGESAALIYTSGASIYMPKGLFDDGASLAVMLWNFSNEGLEMEKAYATAAVLLIFVVLLNLLAAGIEWLFAHREEVAAWLEKIKEKISEKFKRKKVDNNER